MGVRGRGFSCVLKPDSQAKALLPPAWPAALPCGEPVCSLNLIGVRFHGRRCCGRHLIAPHHKTQWPPRNDDAGKQAGGIRVRPLLLRGWPSAQARLSTNGAPRAQLQGDGQGGTPLDRT